jgi:hypothetical protein
MLKTTMKHYVHFSQQADTEAAHSGKTILANFSHIVSGVHAEPKLRIYTTASIALTSLSIWFATNKRSA